MNECSTWSHKFDTVFCDGDASEVTNPRGSESCKHFSTQFLITSLLHEYCSFHTPVLPGLSDCILMVACVLFGFEIFVVRKVTAYSFNLASV